MMIRTHFGLSRDPFDPRSEPLLESQQQILDILLVHASQGGLCLLMGEPGSGKSHIKHALIKHDPKRMITPVINRSLHSYYNILRLLCEAFKLETDGIDTRCEKRLIEEVFALNRQGKMLVPIIDDAHLLEVPCLRKLRLLLEDFPQNHNLILIGQAPLMDTLRLSMHREIRSRITYSTGLKPLAPEDLETFILSQLDRCGLPHKVFTPEALALVVRSGEGNLRRARNLCIGSLIETVRDQQREVDIKQVNRVLLQPHWRNPLDMKD